MRMTKENLLPCPFCGAQASFYPENSGSYSQVMCSECPCDMSLGPVSEADAIAAWNKRADEPRATITQAAEPSSKDVAKAIELLDDASGHLGFYDATHDCEDEYDERADDCLEWAMKEVDQALDILRGFKPAEEPREKSAVHCLEPGCWNLGTYLDNRCGHHSPIAREIGAAERAI